MPPQVLHAPDLGPVPASQPFHGITLVLRRSPEQQAVLDQLLLAQQDRNSPEFHHWLSPKDVADRFGASESDLAAVESWLTTRGFTLAGRSGSRDRILFSGTAAQVTAAFGAPLHRFLIDGEPHVAPAADLSLPSDLAAITSAVLHLSDLRPRPQAHLTPRPAFTSEATQAHYLAPSDLRTLYDIPPDSNAHSSGAGQSIAIVGQSYVDLSQGSIIRQLDNGSFYRSYTEVLVPNSGSEAVSPHDAAESEIDLEYASGVAPFANYLLVHTGSNPQYGVFDALAFAIDQNLAPVISVSYSECETFLSQAEAAQGNALFQQAALQGQTVIAASGDAGSTACAPYTVSQYLSVTQQQALAVGYPADNPYVIAVGGTQLTPGTFDAGNTTFWAPAPATAYDVFDTLLSYVPETAWNESSSRNGIFASGGGTSTVFARPSWQAGVPGIPAGTMRVLPDVALQASGSNPGFLLCTDDAAFLASEGLRVGEGCSFLQTNSPQYVIGGGTSFAAPVFAAMTAMLNQSQQVLGQGNLSATLYQLAQSSNASSVFHDITTGSNTCPTGVARCGAAGQASYNAGTGFDQVTGLGSIDFLHLLQALPTSAPATQASGTSIQLFQPTLNPGETEPLTIGVGTDLTVAHPIAPTGTVSLAIDGVVVDPALALPTTNPYDDSISTVYTYTAATTPGSHVVSATYAGDAHHGPSSSVASILVGNVLAVGNVTLAANNLSLAANSSGTTAVSITPSGGYNGRLFWGLALTSSSNNSAISGCYSIAPVAVDGPSAANLTLGVGTACSSALPAGRARFQPLPGLRSATTPSPHHGPSAAMPIVAGLLLLGLWPVARRRPPYLLGLLALLCAATLPLTACGSGGGGGGSNDHGGGTPPPATQAVTYTFTLTGSDSVNTGLQASTTFTLTLQ